MKAFWEYHCDFGHHWTIFRDEDAPEDPRDTTCPFVTLSKRRQIDAVQVGIRPAGRIVNEEKNQVGFDYQFFLVVTDVHTGEERVSRNLYSWNVAKGLLDQFRNSPANVAFAILNKLDAAVNDARFKSSHSPNIASPD